MKQPLLFLSSMGLIVSCVIQEPTESLPSWYLPEPDQPITAHFNIVDLAVDFSKFQSEKDISSDLQSFCHHHLLTYSPSSFKYAISGLHQILEMEDYCEEKRKPSITIKISGLFQFDTTKVFTKGEVAPKALHNIPNINDYQSHTLTIKSIVTDSNELQVIWENSNSGFDKWQQLSVNGNVIEAGNLDSESVSVIIKSGLSKNRGTFAARSSGDGYDIIPNTVEDSEVIEELCEIEATDADNEETVFDCLVEDSPLVSPTFLRPVYSGGEFHNNLRWKIPIFMTIENN